MKITVREIFEAIAMNGYPWTGGAMIHTRTGTYCAVGQAAKNLGYPDRDATQFNKDAWRISDAIIEATKDDGECVDITYINDDIFDSNGTYENVVAALKEKLEPFFDKVITLPDPLEGE